MILQAMESPLKSVRFTPVPRQGCDAMAVGRGMVLTFAEPTDPTAITVELGDTILLPEGG